MSATTIHLPIRPLRQARSGRLARRAATGPTCPAYSQILQKTLKKSWRNLLDYSALPTLAEKLGIETVERWQGVANIKFHRETKVDREKLMRLVAKNLRQRACCGCRWRDLEGEAEILGRLRERFEAGQNNTGSLVCTSSRL
jgi:hypothetical protein